MAVPPDVDTLIRDPALYGPAAAPASGYVIEFVAPGFTLPSVRAQSARSTPASASARAWATRSWLFAIVGSLADSTEKATTRAARITSAISAIGRATPRSSASVLRRVVFIMGRFPLRAIDVAQPDRGLHGHAPVAERAAARGVLRPGGQLHHDHLHRGRRRRGRGARVAGRVPRRAVRHRQGLHAADDRLGRAAADPVQIRAGELVLDLDAVLIQERHVGGAAERDDLLGRAQLPGHQVEGDACVLLRLDPVGAVGVDLLALLLDRDDRRHDEAQHGGDHEELGQREAALVAEKSSHRHHLRAISMVTMTGFTAVAWPTPVSGR